jgi:UDP-glucose 4-epimerase
MRGGKRVLVSGMGSELGSLVTVLLERESWVSELTGLDIDPPRRRLRRATFHRVEPADRRKMVDLVRAAEPELVVHLAVWEPDARANPRDAARWTREAAIAVLGAAADCRSVEHLVVRSGIAVYGRRRAGATRPDESVPLHPTTPFGESLRHVENVAHRAGTAADVPVTCLRLGPVVGPHVPSPLGRLLRLPAVPVSAVADPPFSLIDDHDAAMAVVAAGRTSHNGPLNVISPGAVTPIQAARLGGRLPVPLLGLGWPLARLVTSALGAPIPPHVLEVLQRGVTADASRAAEILGIRPVRTTPEVVQALYEWATVIHLPASASAA